MRNCVKWIPRIFNGVWWGQGSGKQWFQEVTGGSLSLLRNLFINKRCRNIVQTFCLIYLQNQIKRTKTIHDTENISSVPVGRKVKMEYVLKKCV